MYSWIELHRAADSAGQQCLIKNRILEILTILTKIKEYSVPTKRIKIVALTPDSTDLSPYSILLKVAMRLLAF